MPIEACLLSSQSEAMAPTHSCGELWELGTQLSVWGAEGASLLGRLFLEASKSCEAELLCDWYSQAVWWHLRSKMTTMV